MRLNNCDLGAQQMPEMESLKILGIKFKKNLNQATKANFDSLIAFSNFMFKKNSIRNLNLLQKVWVTNTFVISKL